MTPFRSLLDGQRMPPPARAGQHFPLDRVGAGPVSFRTSLRFSKPSGEINSRGQLGPWNKDDPARTPVSGDYRFENADLNKAGAAKVVAEMNRQRIQ
jgi:hypothetical protein